MYQLNKQSIFAKFFSWLWDTDVANFKTMCPYFWGYVVTILFLPIILPLRIVYAILPRSEKVVDAFEYVGKSKPYKAIIVPIVKARLWTTVGTVLQYAFFTIIGACVLFIIVGLIFTVFKHPLEMLAVVGAIVLIGLIVAAIVHVFTETSFLHMIGTPFRFIRAMFIALYRNWCPLIKWD